MTPKEGVIRIYIALDSGQGEATTIEEVERIVREVYSSARAVTALCRVLAFVPVWQEQVRHDHGGDLHQWSIQCGTCVAEARPLLSPDAKCHCVLCVERAYRSSLQT